MRITDESIHKAMLIVQAALTSGPTHLALNAPEAVAKLLEVVATKIEELRSARP